MARRQPGSRDDATARTAVRDQATLRSRPRSRPPTGVGVVAGAGVLPGARRRDRRQRSELVALRWSDVDLADGTVRIERGVVMGPAGLVEKDTKTHAARRVALDDGTVADRRSSSGPDDAGGDVSRRAHRRRVRVQQRGRRLRVVVPGLGVERLQAPLRRRAPTRPGGGLPRTHPPTNRPRHRTPHPRGRRPARTHTSTSGPARPSTGSTPCCRPSAHSGLHVHALTTWKHWAEGHDVPDRTLQAALPSSPTDPAPNNTSPPPHSTTISATRHPPTVAVSPPITNSPRCQSHHPISASSRSWVGFASRTCLAKCRMRASVPICGIGRSSWAETLRRRCSTSRSHTDAGRCLEPIEIAPSGTTLTLRSRSSSPACSWSGSTVEVATSWIASSWHASSCATNSPPGSCRRTTLPRCVPSPRHDVETTKRPRVACRRRHVLSRATAGSFLLLLPRQPGCRSPRRGPERGR